MKELISSVKEKVETPILTRNQFWLIQTELKKKSNIFYWVMRNLKIWHRKH